MIDIAKDIAVIIFPIISIVYFLGAGYSHKNSYEIESIWRSLNVVFFAVMTISVQISQWNG